MPVPLGGAMNILVGGSGCSIPRARKSATIAADVNCGCRMFDELGCGINDWVVAFDCRMPSEELCEDIKDWVVAFDCRMPSEKLCGDCD